MVQTARLQYSLSSSALGIIMRAVLPHRYLWGSNCSPCSAAPVWVSVSAGIEAIQLSRTTRSACNRGVGVQVQSKRDLWCLRSYHTPRCSSCMQPSFIGQACVHECSQARPYVTLPSLLCRGRSYWGITVIVLSVLILSVFYKHFSSLSWKLSAETSNTS